MLSALVRLAACLVVAGCASAAPGPSITTTASGVPERIPVTVSRPEGPGPFPAVVIMHDCSGLGSRSSGAPGRWAKELVARGYVVVIPDSFTTRGLAGGVCTVPRSERRANASPDRRAGDAHAALAHARALPYVDGRRVAIMGGSHGGSTTLATMMAPGSDSDVLAAEKRAGFAAAVALYPRCESHAAVYRPVAPLLILIGDKDDWTPAEPCRKLADGARAAGQAVTIKVYPGAHHSFDSPNGVRYSAARINPNAPGGRGATTGGEPGAWADSIRQVAAFFDQHLNR
jgi:dienelactone hydrolase